MFTKKISHFMNLVGFNNTTTSFKEKMIDDIQ